MKSKAKKPGRPKMPEGLKKVRFSVTLAPALLKAIDREASPTKGRNALIEDTLEKRFTVI